MQSSVPNLSRSVFFRFPTHGFIDEVTVALVISVLLTVWEAMIFEISYADFVHKTTMLGYNVWTSQMRLTLVATMFGSLVLTLLFVWVSIKSSRIGRAVCFVLFTTAIVCEYSYYGALRRFSIAEDFVGVLFYSDGTMFKDAFLSYVNWKAVLPVTLYGLVLLRIRPQRRVRVSVSLLVLLGAILFYLLTFRVWYLTQSAFPTTALSAFLRTTASVPWNLFQTASLDREPLNYQATTTPTNNIILVVDESIRADHLSLNGYERSTTPYLEQLAQQELVYNWGASVSGATCSLSSNNLLLTGITTLPDRDNRLQQQPSIFQYAKAMGYTTHYLDASNATFWNGTRDDLQYIDHWENAQRFSHGHLYDADTALADYTRSLVAQSQGNFIWINKRGVHFSYNHTFPAERAVWTPIMSGYDHDPDQRRGLVNAYDNGLRYNLEAFFRTLVDDPTLLEHTTIIYTSDHGQTLADHGETWSHCSDSPNEALVPLFMLTADQYGIDTGYKAHHANIFATVLDLMYVPPTARPYSYEQSLFHTRATDSQPRLYYVGSLNGNGGGEFKRFDP